MKNKYDVAAIIWPSYSGDDPRTKIFWQEGYGEWQTVRAMTDKGYDGCRWPRKPLWGYVNEADKYVMEMQIKAAVEHSVNVFIYDWYWYDDRPFLENCLDDGFLKASNNKDMRFYLMWANHNATYLWDKRNSEDRSTVVWKGSVTPEIFYNICDRTIEKYFKRDNYYTIEGCPVYMIFELDNFVRSFGSTGQAKKAITRFREKTKQAGFNGLHLQCAFFNNKRFLAVPESDPLFGISKKELMFELGFDSFTNYNWACCTDPDKDYCDMLASYKEIVADYATWSTPFYPNITIGWDNNLRFNKFVPGVTKNNPPEQIFNACEFAKEFIDGNIGKKLKVPLITVNSWNEWTEGSYLEPDDLYGYGYLEALKKAFSDAP